MGRSFKWGAWRLGTIEDCTPGGPRDRCLTNLEGAQLDFPRGTGSGVAQLDNSPGNRDERDGRELQVFKSHGPQLALAMPGTRRRRQILGLILTRQGTPQPASLLEDLVAAFLHRRIECRQATLDHVFVGSQGDPEEARGFEQHAWQHKHIPAGE